MRGLEAGEEGEAGSRSGLGLRGQEVKKLDDGSSRGRQAGHPKPREESRMQMVLASPAATVATLAGRGALALQLARMLPRAGLLARSQTHEPPNKPFALTALSLQLPPSTARQAVPPARSALPGSVRNRICALAQDWYCST